MYLLYSIFFGRYFTAALNELCMSSSPHSPHVSLCSLHLLSFQRAQQHIWTVLCWAITAFMPVCTQLHNMPQQACYRLLSGTCMYRNSSATDIGCRRAKPSVLVAGLQSGGSTNSGGGGTQSTSSNLSQHLTYTSYILKQTPQVSDTSTPAGADERFRLLSSKLCDFLLCWALAIASCASLPLTSP